MIGRAWLRKAVIAMLLGSIWPFILLQLFEFSAYVTMTLAQTARDVGLTGNLKLVVRALNAVVWGLALGALFGIPFGLAVRTNVIVYWLIFVASLVTTSAAIALHSNAGVGILLLEWSLPETWIHILAVLCFMYWAARFRGRRESARVVAP